MQLIPGLGRGRVRAATVLAALCSGLVVVGACAPGPQGHGREVESRREGATPLQPAAQATPRAAATTSPAASSVTSGDDGRRLPLPDVVEPPAAAYLGLGRWSCDEVEQVTDGALRRLDASQVRDGQAFCYVLNGAEGEAFAPPPGEDDPWQAGVLYTSGEPERATLDDILDRGGALLSVDFGVPEPPPPPEPEDEQGDASSLWTEAEGEVAVLHRTSPGRLAGVWFAGEAGHRVRVILMTGGSEEHALRLMDTVEVGRPQVP